MGYKQPNNPMKMMKSALKMYKADKKAGMHRDSAMYMNSPMYKGHSPMEMGHESPAEMGHESPAKNVNKGYGYEVPKRSALKRESRELKDMPIVDIEKGDAKGSPAKAAKPDFPDIDGDGNTSESMKQAAADKKKGSPAKMKKGEKDEKSGKSKPKLKDFQSKEGKGPRVGDVKPGTIIPTGGSPYKDKKKKGSPAKKYDRVVLGGNKGDKSKTKPGKKDYSGNQPDLKKYSEDKKKK